MAINRRAAAAAAHATGHTLATTYTHTRLYTQPSAVAIRSIQIAWFTLQLHWAAATAETAAAVTAAAPAAKVYHQFGATFAHTHTHTGEKFSC